MQYLKMVQKKYILSLMIVGCLVMFVGGAMAGDRPPQQSPSNGEPSMGPVQITATIMEINKAKSYMVIAERTFIVTRSNNALGAEKHKTQLLDESGGAAKFGSFEKDQRVSASGMELPDGTIIAEKIQRLPSKSR